MNLSSNAHITWILTGCKTLSPDQKLNLTLRSLPGVPPTGKKLRIPFTGIVNVRGDRLYHEHIAWDQASALVQLGLMPEYLPYPYPLPDGQTPAEGKQFQYKVPAAGQETAQKMLDRNSVPSNEMFEFKVREVPL